ncbi:MAG: glycosyltransferase family 2 protein [Sediminibacterium sp.]|nr:glycosyltransferase family 2 protein [Sediminibacterium sp.]
MKVSIITATYNSSNTIVDTLDSIKNQSYSNIEHIIIDGASNDNTIEIVKSKAPQSAIHSEKDQGIYDAMNKGIAIAKGDIIGILNSDDFYASHDIIEKVVQLFEKENCDAVYGDLIYVDGVDLSKIKRHWKAGPYHKNHFLYGWMPPHPTFFVRRAVYEQYGGFNLNLFTAADYELMLRFLYRYGIKVAYLQEVMVKMRTGGASNQSIGNRLLANKGDRLAWKINGLTPYWFTLFAKPIRKISQFIR